MSAPLSPDPLSSEQSAAMAAALTHTAPASGEDVRRALSDAQSVGGHNHQALIHERLRRIEVRVPAIVRRLLDAEARVAELEAERHSTNEALSDAATALRAKSQQISEQHDDLVHALGRDGAGLDWSDLVELATGYMRTAEGLEKAKDERIAALETAVRAAAGIFRQTADDAEAKVWPIPALFRQGAADLNRTAEAGGPR